MFFVRELFVSISYLGLRGTFGILLVPSWVRGPHFALFWAPWAPLGGALGHIGRTLGLLWGSLEATWATLGSHWALHRPLGATLEGFWHPLGATLVSLGLSLGSLGLSVVPLGLFLISFGVSWAPWEPFSWLWVSFLHGFGAPWSDMVEALSM